MAQLTDLIDSDLLYATMSKSFVSHRGWSAMFGASRGAAAGRPQDKPFITTQSFRFQIRRREKA
ncbi:hypothetical protein [Burkholderia pyrrocinia]